jgi:hypothetical protein
LNKNKFLSVSKNLFLFNINKKLQMTFPTEKITQLLNNCSNTECEFRFGSFSNNKFSPGVSKAQFDKLFIFIKSFAEYKHSIDENTMTIVKGKTRERIYIDGNPLMGSFDDNKVIKKENIKKENIEKIDIVENGIRFSVSSEIACSESSEIGSYFKVMQRFTFYYLNFKIEMSIFKSSNSLDSLYQSEVQFDIEIEIVTMTSTKNILNFIFDISKQINDNNNSVIDHYRLLTKQKHFFGTQPIALRLERLDKTKKYSISLKLDGLRVMILVSQNNIHFINSKFNSGPLEIVLKSDIFDGSIFDTEYKDGVYHIFDCIVFKNKDLRSIDGVFLEKRLEFIKSFVDFCDNRIIVPKKHHFGNIHNTSMKLIKEAINETYDGLIYTPMNELYPKNSKCLGVPLKWKAPRANTIDFRIRRISETESGLFVATEKEEVLFNTKEYPNIHIISFNPELTENGIFECGFDIKSNKFVVVKERKDKIKPNFISVALDNFDLIINPFDFDNLSSNRNRTYFFNMRRFHNWIKRTILDEFTVKNGKGGHLDLACGKGGDIFKYFDNSVRYLEGYDISNESIISAKSRLEKAMDSPIHKNSNYSFYIKDLSKELINTSVQFDSAACFFAIHYFFESEETLRNFINNTKQLQSGGHIMFTCFDSSKLKGSDYNLTTDKFKISKGSVDSSKIFGNSIDVFLEETVLDIPTTEYLVDIPFLISEMTRNGFVLVLSKDFEEYYNDWMVNDNYLNNISKKFSFLNKVLVFRKKHSKVSEIEWDLVDETVSGGVETSSLNDLSSKTILELRSLAKAANIKIPKNSKKTDIISLLQ